MKGVKRKGESANRGGERGKRGGVRKGEVIEKERGSHTNFLGLCSQHYFSVEELCDD